MTIEAQKSYIFQGKIDEQVPNVLKGEGVKITVEHNGVTQELIDGVTGAAVGALGWGDPDVLDMITEAAKVTSYSYPAYIGNKYSEALAKFYIDHSPEGAFASALWCGSGSESNENALKIIRQYHLEKNNVKKIKFISRKTSYHGFTIGSMSISSNPRTATFKDILLPSEQCPKMEVCYPYRNQKKNETTEEYVARLMTNLEELILKEDPETVAAVIVETLPGSSLGTSPPPPGYLPGIRKLCNKYDVIMMLDEVMCGTGRVTPNGGLNCWENFLTVEEGPDIQTVGKTLGSGYVTIAGILISPKMRNVFLEGSGRSMGAHTYSGHGFNCLVALKIQEKIQAQGLTKNIFKMGNLMGEKLKKTLEDSPVVGDVRGLGGFWSIEFVKNKDTKESFPLALDVTHRVQDQCFDNGLTVMGNQGCNDGTGDHVSIAPHFIVTEEDIDSIVTILTKSVGEIVEQLKAEGEL
ncbi:aminotransferase [Scheffersomyces xylosifermentans]|uniref:aminotransferase n=1 Tax=Scheffersomyces xylosifermentans TaxID=1304137 RepID=UPI00315C5D0D